MIGPILRKSLVVPFLLVIALLSSMAWAAPKISNFSPRGIQIGATTVITFTGSGLSQDAHILLPVSISKQQIQPGSNATRVRIAVTLDASVPAGIYPLRLAGKSGVSSSLPVGIDSLPQIAFRESIEKLPVALHGTLTGGQSVRTTFTGKKGQRVVVDLESRRLAGKLNPVLHLTDSRGVQLAWAQAQAAISDDARLDTVLPADGLYTVVIHDALRQGAAPGHFRLKIGALHYADMTYPLAVRRGAKASLELAGSNIPPDQSAAVDSRGPGFIAPVVWPKLANITGGRPSFTVSDFPEVVENSASDSLQEVTGVPVGINGRLSSPGEEDVYKVHVQPGSKLRIAVVAAQLGSPLDAVLMVRDEQGRQLAVADDQKTTADPSLVFAVPAGNKVIQLAIKDLVSHGGRDFVYRIVVTPEQLPGFQILLDRDQIIVPSNGVTVVRVRANRTAYQGPIQLSLDSLPPGVELSGKEIPAGTNQTLLTLTAPGATYAQTLGFLTAVSTDLKNPLVGNVKIGGSVSSTSPWLSNQLALAVVDPSPLSVAWQLDSGLQSQLLVGVKLSGKVTVVRNAKLVGPIRLSLLTTQTIPKKKVKKNKNTMVDDLARAIRLEGKPMIAADGRATTVAVLVPGDLPRTSYDLALRAELLSADGKQVIHTSVTPAVRLLTAVPPAIEPLALFEDSLESIAELKEGKGTLDLTSDDKFSGVASVKVTQDQRSNAKLPGLNVKIREYPEQGEVRFITFAWKKNGGEAVCLQVAHDGKFGPVKGKMASFRYHAGPAMNCYGGSLSVSETLPADWTLVTRDLYKDFGEFTLTGLSLAAVDGEFALFDHIYLGRTAGDFSLVKPKQDK